MHVSKHACLHARKHACKCSSFYKTCFKKTCMSDFKGALVRTRVQRHLAILSIFSNGSVFIPTRQFVFKIKKGDMTSCHALQSFFLSVDNLAISQNALGRHNQPIPVSRHFHAIIIFFIGLI
jgi:hypothetical protein